ncbi:MAG: 50S ribosomal protein L4 [Planctomycetota bacterium]
MIELAVIHHQDGTKGETIRFSEDVLGGKVKKRLVRDVVIFYGHNQRVGTARTKSRGEVEGSKRKLYRQKGTGRARAGPIRTPVRVGGGRAHGPKPRDYSVRINRPARRGALRSALLSKFRDGEVVVLDAFTVPEPKTRHAAEIFAKAGVRERCLLVVEGPSGDLWRAVRNIPFVRMLPVKDLNAYEVVRAHKLVFTKQALESLVGGAS